MDHEPGQLQAGRAANGTLRVPQVLPLTRQRTAVVNRHEELRTVKAAQGNRSEHITTLHSELAAGFPKTKPPVDYQPTIAACLPAQ